MHLYAPEDEIESRPGLCFLSGAGLSDTKVSFRSILVSPGIIIKVLARLSLLVIEPRSDYVVPSFSLANCSAFLATC